METNVNDKPKFFYMGRDVPKADSFIRGAYIALICISVVEFYSASSSVIRNGAIFSPVISHVFSLLLGVLVMYVTSRIHYSYFRLLIPVFALLSMVAVIYSSFFGETINGAHRTFSLGFINVQPPEFVKLSAALITALILSNSQLPDRPGVTNKGLAIAAGAILIFGALLFSEGLTNTILMMTISLSVMICSGVGVKKFLIVMLVYAIVGACGVVYKISHRDDKSQPEEYVIAQVDKSAESKGGGLSNRSGEWLFRIFDFFRGDSVPLYQQDITSKNAQKMYSHLAQAHGGVVGVMPGNARENTRLPLVSSDFIYALIVEDFGLIGGLIVLFLYIFIFVRAGDLSRRCNATFPKLLLLACGVMIVFQALFHMSIVTGAFPVSGQPLPLISRGGTSILATSGAFGVMLSVTRFADFGGRKKKHKAKQAEEEAKLNLDNIDNIDDEPVTDEYIKSQLD